MAQFVFENDVNSLLKLDAPITNGPLARWQRKAKENSGVAGSLASANTSGLSPMKTTNRSLNASKTLTPSKTPGKTKTPKSSKCSRVQITPSKVGGDRYIPTRNAAQMDVAHFLINKDQENESPTKKEQQKAWSLNLNGYDIDQAKILRLSGKPLHAPEGYQNNLKVLYSQKTPSSTKKISRYIPSMPERILDAPEIRNDYYLNLIDWSTLNYLAVALGNNVYLWHGESGNIVPLVQLENPEDYISSVSWIKEGNYLAVGTMIGEVQVWDVENQKRLRNMVSQTARVGALNWNSYILSSGSRLGQIHHHDVRIAQHHVATLAGHTQEVCGLKWSPDGRYLASGGNDNILNIWPSVPGNDTECAPLHTFTQHQGAVKAVAWCPWQANILASGGGTSDRFIRLWNVNTGSCLNAVDTRSQVCSIVWSTEYKELVSGHGYSQNQLVMWKYPTLTKVAELKGHQARVLDLALSPDGTTVCSAAADETLRVWKCFAVDPAKKKKMTTNQPSMLHHSIR
ncbi:cell division cycle protein 20 homolog [Callorhinchus milii]|uniref:Cell division cycle protein 20 homolog n=1 Tax=Callorhinchus milii TaxID=7868 RepID=V9KNW4_CALMI|nr:cell division cycle protein 20 homolog [Callorhinchus milii]|eukprot:gi/632940352/ref/XP_007885272.1/ PREDICTED: cell division cycle protein 20 homolog [Callorhinchus milii]